MDQSEFVAITCNLLKGREKSHLPGTIGFGFASHWWKHRREIFKPITKHNNRNRVSSFDSQVKTGLRRSG